MQSIYQIRVLNQGSPKLPGVTPPYCVLSAAFNLVKAVTLLLLPSTGVPFRVINHHADAVGNIDVFRSSKHCWRQISWTTMCTATSCRVLEPASAQSSAVRLST